ncbi:FecR family protein [Dyadobacter pollutisoli]|uniref:FecR family protein n=1 Tax=Dyadobacter pollutisoli TaxID=2910158 RepID=A0A9E8NAL4_9BACT|nr:FecR family protein [Dyadobacter pollutisoli]WAC13025.1 FecR family protein [Dyadobacter pollutisoli]
MNQYKEYSLEDFVLDANFQKWVRYARLSDSAFWQSYVESNPAQENDILQAKALLTSVYRHYSTDINDADIDIEIQELLSKVRMTKAGDPVINTVALNQSLGNYVFKKTSLFWAAASVILVLGLGWLFMNVQKPKSNYEVLTEGKALVEEENDSDASKTLMLADGSKIVLQPKSRVSYPSRFLADKREVYLSGEASFEIAKDHNRPFLVYANDLVTKVLGTSFTVKARDASQNTTVEVKEGKVSVFRQVDFADGKGQNTLKSKGLVLTANQKIVFEHQNSDMVKTIRDTPEIVASESSPKTFDFVNAPASLVLDELKNAYQIDIIYDRDLLSGCPLTALLTRQSLFEKLDIICEVIEARYETIDGQIVVYSKGCKN